jgi:hypothetical protein
MSVLMAGSIVHGTAGRMGGRSSTGSSNMRQRFLRTVGASSSLTGIETVRERMASVGLMVREVASIRCPGERLVVLRGSLLPSF